MKVASDSTVCYDRSVAVKSPARCERRGRVINRMDRSMQDQTSTPYGYCECGCGKETFRWKYTQLSLGRVKGEPARYVHGHGARITGKRYVEEDRGHATPCWIWQGALTKGYGVIQRRGRGASPEVVHRLNWEAIHGPVPEGLELDHLCNVQACVNPDHLEPVTHAENMRRWMRRDGRCA